MEKKKQTKKQTNLSTNCNMNVYNRIFYLCHSRLVIIYTVLADFKKLPRENSLQCEHLEFLS